MSGPRLTRGLLRLTQILGGKVVTDKWSDCPKRPWRATLYTCLGDFVREGLGRTERDAIVSLHDSLRAAAKAILADEYDFEEDPS